MFQGNGGQVMLWQRATRLTEVDDLAHVAGHARGGDQGVELLHLKGSKGVTEVSGDDGFKRAHHRF